MADVGLGRGDGEAQFGGDLGVGQAATVDRRPATDAAHKLGTLIVNTGGPRDPGFYWDDIQDHLATEPFYGPWRRTINPCAFWPTTPIEPPTTIDNPPSGADGRRDL